MRVGDLVKSTYTGEVHIVTSRDVSAESKSSDYVVVDSQWLVPVEHLEVISESR